MASEPDDLAAVVMALVDRDAAIDLVHRYVDRIDAFDIEGACSLLHEDADAELAGIPRRGVQEIGRHLTRALARFTATSHHVTNPLVTLDGDRAEVSAGVYACHRWPAGERWHFWGRYRFVLERADAEWRIRQLRLAGIDGGPDLDPAERDLYAGHPDRRDPPRDCSS